MCPFAPHLAEEIWAMIGHERPICSEAWPKWDPAALESDTIELVIQINGKLRDRLEVPAGASKDEIEKAAMASEKVASHLSGKTVRKVMVVPKKLVNIVVS